jgi:hypothetical protein
MNAKLPRHEVVLTAAGSSRQRRRAVGALVTLFAENDSKQSRSLYSRGVEAWQAHMLAGVINGESSAQLPRRRTSQRHKHTANLLAGKKKEERRRRVQGPLLLQREVEEPGLEIGRPAPSGLSVCILTADIHHMRHVVRQTRQVLVRQTGMSRCLSAIDIGRARRLPSTRFERSESTTARGSPGPAAQRGSLQGYCEKHIPGTCRSCAHPATVCIQYGLWRRRPQAARDMRANRADGMPRHPQRPQTQTQTAMRSSQQ